MSYAVVFSRKIAGIIEFFTNNLPLIILGFMGLAALTTFIIVVCLCFRKRKAQKAAERYREQVTEKYMQGNMMCFCNACVVMFIQANHPIICCELIDEAAEFTACEWCGAVKPTKDIIAIHKEMEGEQWGKSN